jgi:copper homeostasis protein
MIFEICASTPVDVAVAMEAGADRVELCSHWECGGLTPTPSLIRSSVSMGLPVRALVRPRAGNFYYNNSEKQLCLAEALDCLDAGAERVVVGGLTKDDEIDEGLLELLCSKIPAEKFVFHRALDRASDIIHASELILDFDITSALSSGGAPAAGLGLDNINEMCSLGLNVIAGGGVRIEDIVKLGEAGVEAVHISCRKKEVYSEDEIFDMSTYPVDFEKASVFYDAVAKWNL